MATTAIQGLCLETGLKLRWDKCYVHCRDKDTALAVKTRFARIDKNIKVRPTLDMKYLKVPIGSDQWVAKQLEEKLEELKSTIEKVTSMPQRQEAFTLLKSDAHHASPTTPTGRAICTPI